MYQAAATAVAATVASIYMNEAAARAVCFGGAVAIANTLLLAWRIIAAARGGTQNPRLELAKLVRSSVERFLVVALLIAAGLGWLKLMPMPLVVGFVLGQLTLVVSTIISQIEK